MTVTLLAFVTAEIEGSGRGSNVAAGIAGFTLMALWVVVAVVQVVRQRRRRRFDAPVEVSGDEQGAVGEQQSTTSVGTAQSVRDDAGGSAGVAAGLLLAAIVLAGVLGFLRAVARAWASRSGTGDPSAGR